MEAARRGGPWANADDQTLLGGLLAGCPEAVDEFIARFEALVRRYAVWLRIPPEDRAHWTGEVLFDVARTLSRRRSPGRIDMPLYVAGACRLKARRARDVERRRLSRARARAEDVAGTGEYVEPQGCSENALRLVRSADWEPPGLSPLLERLVSALNDGITPAERELLSWLAEHVSYTTISAWLGISRPAAVSRVQRLRKRLMELACGFAGTLDANDAAGLVRFLRRTGAVPESRITGIADARNDARVRRVEP